MARFSLGDWLKAIWILAALGITPSHAVDQIRELIPSADKVGQGRLTYLFWDVYDATLYAPQGIWRENSPFALRLSYLRELHGKIIADRSIEEIRNQGFSDEIKLATWHAQLRNIVPDVNKGMSLTGIFTDTGVTIFYKDDEEIGRISDPQFSQAFANIWLSEKTSAPDLRRRLLGAL